MAMIPPSTQDPRVLQQQRSPQFADRFPSSAPQPTYQEQLQQAYAPQWQNPQQPQQPQVLDPNIQRKVDIAQGRGLRVNPQLVQATHGEQIMLQYDNGYPMPCKYCQANPCYGTRWIFDDEVRFKCNTCGKNQKLGYTGVYAAQNQANLEGWGRAEYNRRALWRDQDAQAQEQMRQQFHQYASDPNAYLSALRNPQFVEGNFFA